MAHPNLPTWMNALASAVSDFASQALNTELNAELTEPVSEVKVPKFGSSLSLFCTDEEKVTLYFLADKEHIQTIAEQLLGLEAGESLSEEDMHDAVKEIINVLSGGVKSRLSDQFPEEIVLSLPQLVHSKLLQPEENTLHAVLEVKGMPIYLSVQEKIGGETE